MVYAHIDHPDTPQLETLTAFDALVRAGSIGAIAASNFTVDRLRAAKEISAAHGLAGYVGLQARVTYLTARPDAEFGVQVPLDSGQAEYTAEQRMTVLGYSSLLEGCYARPDKPVPEQYRHAGTDAQLAAVRATATRLGVTPSQVVYAWLGGRGILPIFGVSSITQLDEALGGPVLDDQAVRDLDAARQVAGRAEHRPARYAELVLDRARLRVMKVPARSVRPRVTPHPAVVRTARRRPLDGSRPGENARPPRYRLLAAVAALPPRETMQASESFERACPACGKVIVFTQIRRDSGVEYAIDEHGCLDP